MWYQNSEVCTLTRRAMKRKFLTGVSATFFFFIFTLLHVGILQVNWTPVALNGSHISDVGAINWTRPYIPEFRFFSPAQETSSHQNLETVTNNSHKSDLGLYSTFISDFGIYNLFPKSDGNSKTGGVENANKHAETQTFGAKNKKEKLNGKYSAMRGVEKSKPKNNDQKFEEGMEREEEGRRKDEEKGGGEEEKNNVKLPARADGKNPSDYVKDEIETIKWTEDEAAEVQREIESRITLMKDGCNSNIVKNAPKNKNKFVQNNLIYVKDYDLLWCPIFKSASTTMVKNLLLLANVTDLKEGLHKHARGLYPPPMDLKPLYQDSNTTKLMIVRNPLDRILSAYRDKMLRFRGTNDRFVQMQNMISKHYKDPNPSPPPSSTPTPTGTTKNEEREIPPPTFTQFLMKVRDDMKAVWEHKSIKVNLHWRPFWLTCDPCTVPYNIVAHVDTLTRDQEYIIRLKKLTGTFFNIHAHKSNFDSYEGTSEATKHYYSQVPKKLLRDIIKYYKPDFKLFGYSPQPYLDIVNKSKHKKSGKYEKD